MLDITRVLTISTAHVTEETIQKLEKEPYTNFLWLSVYPKAEYGFWISCTSYEDEEYENIPEDLRDCIRFTLKNECDWLCLDCDGEIVEELKTYQ